MSTTQPELSAHRFGARARALLARQHGLIWILGGSFVAIAFVTRSALMLKSASEVSWDVSLLGSFLLGCLFDLGTAALACLPFVLVLSVVPARLLQRRFFRVGAHVVLFVWLYALLFGAVAEWVFWDEFATRFNFIAVDYLVYTTEVLGNIRESYPLPAILAGLLLLTALIQAIIVRAGWVRTWYSSPPQSASRRLLAGAVMTAVALILGLGLSEDHLPAFANAYNREIAKNGVWSLFAAFKNNVLDYEQFYCTVPQKVAFARLREELVEDSSILLRPDAFDTLRYVRSSSDEIHPNVIQITVESLSAEFLGIFDPRSTLTPNLDALARQSLVFENCFATGTRTDRGMEALTLSLPPTPGRSLVKRPRNEDLFTLGSVFRSKGYDTAFLYGGFGYFDNMNYYFGHNGYRVVDRNAVAAEDITFANVWGACDEDLYRWTMREADASHASGRPFHYFVMTTSNHRPFTFPEGRIDLPSKTSGRQGAVKYTDFAIGQFLHEARTHPWFKNTVFVIVADHCASSAGKSEVPVDKYHIPLLVYAPGGQVAPGRLKSITSQMDFAPTLLGLLGWSYPSRFFGHDIRHMDDDEGHALVGNYQKLGHLEKGSLVVLKPQRTWSTYHFDLATSVLTPAAPDIYGQAEAIAFYQSASYAYKHDLYKALTPAESAHYSTEGEHLAAMRHPAVAPK